MKVIFSLPIVGLALSLAACSGGGDEEAPPVAETNITNTVTEEPIDIGNIPQEAPPATRVDNATAVEEPAPETLGDDEQTQDDADATGMTSRVNRNETEAAE